MAKSRMDWKVKRRIKFINKINKNIADGVALTAFDQPIKKAHLLCRNLYLELGDGSKKRLVSKSEAHKLGNQS